MLPRIGYGYDVHKLAEGYDLWLGGVKIDYKLGAVGHSDADVLLHAICDALLGAASLRDIGFHFPDTDPQYKGISSLILLQNVGELIISKGFIIGNIDSTIVLQRPKVASLIPQMQFNIARALNISDKKISVKATTSEGLGFEGRQEGVSAHAVALILEK